MTEALTTIQPSAIELPESSANVADAYIASLSAKRSKDTMWQSLARITDILAKRDRAGDIEENKRRAREFDWASLRSFHVEVIKAEIAEKVSKGSTNKFLCAIRGVMKTARRMRKIPMDEYQDIKDIKGFQLTGEPRGRALSEDEMLSLAMACKSDKTAAGVRDAALMAVAYGTGMRRFEIAALNLKDWNAEDSSLRVGHGKGDKFRMVYLSASGARCLQRWLAIRPATTIEGASLFCPVNKGGKVREHRITPQAIYNILDKRRIQAGIAEFSPHDMRRTFISDLLDAGADISAVAGLAGHVDINTTRRYDRRGERAKKAAASKIVVPF